MDGVPWTKPVFITRRCGDKELLFKVEEHYVPGKDEPVRVRCFAPDGTAVEGHEAVREMLGIDDACIEPAQAVEVSAEPIAIADEEPAPIVTSGHGLDEAQMIEIRGRIAAERTAKLQEEALTWTSYKPWEETRELRELTEPELKMQIAWMEERMRESAPEIARQTAARIRLCHFVKSDGEPCGSPALKKRRYCYFHEETRAGSSKKTKTAAVELPVLEDDRALQIAITRVCRGLADESLDPKRASTLLYGLQVAAVAVRKRPETAPK